MVYGSWSSMPHGEFGVYFSVRSDTRTQDHCINLEGDYDFLLLSMPFFLVQVRALQEARTRFKPGGTLPCRKNGHREDWLYGRKGAMQTIWSERVSDVEILSRYGISWLSFRARCGFYHVRSFMVLTFGWHSSHAFVNDANLFFRISPAELLGKRWVTEQYKLSLLLMTRNLFF